MANEVREIVVAFDDSFVLAKKFQETRSCDVW
jgi:hypothetical protein